MKSVIYLDELLLTNFVLAVLFLTAAGLLCATVCTGVRLCTGAALAAVSALVLLARSCREPWQLVIKFSQVARWWPPPTACRAGAFCSVVCVVCTAQPTFVRSGGAARRAEPQPERQPAPVPGRLLASCAGVYAVLRALLYCFGRSGAPSVPATLEVAGVQLRYRPSTTPALPCKSR